jgi:hypothetical protein
VASIGADLIIMGHVGRRAVSFLPGQADVRCHNLAPSLAHAWPTVMTTLPLPRSAHALNGQHRANTFLAGLGDEALATLMPGQEWLGSFGVEGVLTMLIFAAIGDVLYRQHKNNLRFTQEREKKM